MYGKTLSIPDEAMSDYFRLLLQREPPAEHGGRGMPSACWRASWWAGCTRPSRRSTAERQFDRVFVEHEAPEQIEEALCRGEGEDGMVHLPEVMAQAFGMSRSEARRLIEQGGVSLDEADAGRGEHDVAVERADGAVLKVGKRRFRRLRAG